MGFKWGIEKFSRDIEFGLSKVKIKAILIQHMCVEAFKNESLMHVSLTQTKKSKMMDKVRIFICALEKKLYGRSRGRRSQLRCESNLN